jgi:hypothetical protein
MVKILKVESSDVRFPTSLDKTGSDAMNAAGDYSAAYCILKTDSEHVGHGMVSYYFGNTRPLNRRLALSRRPN